MDTQASLGLRVHYPGPTSESPRFIAHVHKASIPTTAIHDAYQAKRNISGGSMFVEHLEDPEPTQDELEAFDCLRDPFLSARRMSQDMSLRSPPLSPRSPLSQSQSSSIFPNLVRKLSQSASAKKARLSDGRRASKVDSPSGRTVSDDTQIIWSPKLAKEHPSPRPPRRTRSGSGARESRNAARPSIIANRRISFADESFDDSLEDETRAGEGSKWSPEESADIEASLNNFSVKRFSLPNFQSYSPTAYLRSSTGHPGSLYSPVEERRMSFEVLRLSQASHASPRTSFQQSRSSSPLAKVDDSIRYEESPSKGWHRNRPNSPLSSPSNCDLQSSLGNMLDRSTSTASSISSTPFEPVPGSRFLPEVAARPSSRRSLSASLVSLGKKVANLSSRSSASPGRDALPGLVVSPSFKVNGVYRVDPSSPSDENRRVSLSASGSSRPSSPLATAAPVLAKVLEQDSETGALSTSVPLLSPSFIVDSRPALIRNAKSDDGERKAGPVSPLRQSIRPSSSLLSPTRALQPLAGASPAIPSHIEEEREESEDWLASLRGRPTQRRMSAADLFAPPSPLPQLAASSSGSSSSGVRSPLATSPIVEEDGLDFSKKPVNISSDTLVLQTDSTHQAIPSANRQRTTSYSSLLSSSRPNTPSSAFGTSVLRPFPSLPSSPSPTPNLKFLPNHPVHRHTQSSPAMALAAEIVQLSSQGPAGGEASVLNANHAKFAAVLTAAAVAQAASPKVSNVILTGDKDKIRRMMNSKIGENAVDDSSDEEEEGELDSRARQSKIRTSLAGDLRMPKLSYGGSSSTGTETSLQPSEGFSPPNTSSSNIRASSSFSTSIAGIPKQPIFSQSGSNLSSHQLSAISNKGAFDALYDRKGTKQVDGLPSLWTGARRDNNSSEESQVTVLSGSTSGSTTSGGEEDVFQPKMPVW